MNPRFGIQMMLLSEAIGQLKEFGTAQTKKTYLRHGANEPLFGVKFGDLAKLKKKIRIDHDLAVKLWATGNSDAQTLALMVLDPAKMKSTDLDCWLRDVDYYLLIDMVAGVAAKTRFAKTKWNRWKKAKSDAKLSAAYSLVGAWLCESPLDVPDDVIQDALERIENSIADSPNRTRHCMNQVLISTGVHREDFRKEVLRIAKQIGTVEVDHGDTACKTPDAISYIKKSVEHMKKKQQK